MSRQRGARERSRVDQVKYREQFTRRGGRPRPIAAATDDGERLTPRRRWRAIIWSTLVLVIVFGAIITGVIQEEEGNTRAATTAIAVAAALVPMSFSLLAYLSRRRRPMGTVALASAFAIAGFFGLGALLSDPAVAFVFAFGIAGALVLRAEPNHRVTLRISLVSIASLVVMLLGFLAPAVAVVAAPFLAFPALGVADRVAESRLG